MYIHVLGMQRNCGDFRGAGKAIYLSLSSGSGVTLGGRAEELHQPGTRGIAGTFLEELSGSFYHADLFGDGNRNPLIQRHAVFFRQSLCGLLYRKGQLQWISSSTHALTHLSHPIGFSPSVGSGYFCISVDWLAAHNQALPSLIQVSVKRPWW